MPPTKTTDRTRRTTRTKAATTTVDNPVTKSLSKPTLRDPRPPARQPSRVVPSPPAREDERTSCMRTVNLSLQTLSAVTQSGWKFTPEGTKGVRSTNANASKVDDATRTAEKALRRLREITPDDLDVERAACSITGKLIALELYEEAIRFLDGMHPRLLGIASTARSGSDYPPPLHLLSLPCPTSGDPTVLTLLITSVTHALNALLSLLLRPSPPFPANALATALERSHSLLAWAPTMQNDNIPEKTRDAFLTKAYTFINKACTALSSSDRSSADPESTFHLRMYALACLLYTTPGTIKSTTFWDQVHKACFSCARTLSSGPAGEEREVALAARISHRLDAVVRLAQSLCDRTFFEGRSFVQMCETWMNFAQKGDMSMLDHVSTLMGVPCPSSSFGSKLDADAPTSRVVSECSVDALADRIGGLQLSDSADVKSVESTSCHSTKDAALVECAQCCGLFVKATASLDSEGPELARHAKEAAEAVRRYCKLVSNLDALSSSQPLTPSLAQPDSAPHSSMDAELLRARGKLERALERLRRASLRVLDAPQVRNQSSRHVATALLEAIVVALESALTQHKTRSHQHAETRSTLTSLVDVFFALARFRLQPADVESYTPALSYLERAVVVVESSLTGMMTTDDAATLLRCISGTLHNLGGTLYAAGRLGGAIRFLKGGCVLGRRVLAMYGSASIGDDKSDREKEGRRQLEEQLFRRYELLGVCHSKIGDRKLAYECFVDSVRTFPYTHHLSAFSCADPFEASAPLALKQLSSIVERLTYAATCEIFLPPAQITLGWLSLVSETDSGTEQTSQNLPISTFPSEDGRSRTEIAGAILTRQLATLENIGHKDGAREAMGRVLEDLLAAYDPGWAPVRRARVLVAALGVCWRDPDGSGMRLDVDGMGREALALLSLKTPESEVQSVVRLVPQLRVSVNMWMALHAYRRLPDAGAEMMHAVATHVEAAYDVLCGLLPGSEASVALEGKSAKATRGASTRPKKGQSAVVNGGAKSGKRGAMDATAKPQGRQALRAVSLSATEPTGRDVAPAAEKAPAVDLDLQPILGLIQMNVHLLGLLGLIVLKVKLLGILKRICECQIPHLTQAYVVICVDLAYEYVKLGKSKRANALFNKCANMLKVGEEREGQGGADVPDEVKLQYLLGRAEVLALGGNISASASAYCDAQSLEAAVALEDKDKTMPTAKRIRARVERLERAALACRVFAAVQHAKNNVVGALCSMLQSLRLWNRAVDALARLAPPSTSGKSKTTDPDANPFEVIPSDTKQREEAHSPPLGTKPTSTPTPTPADALSWRLLSHLVSTLFALAHAYHVRGSPREALYFVQQVQDLAESARAPAVMARASIVRGEVLLGQGALQEARETLERAAELLGGVVGVDAADAQRLRGDYGVLCEEEEEHATDSPKEHYERARRMLDEFERRIASSDSGGRRSSLESLPMGAVANSGQGMVVPRLLSAILRRHIWLLRDDGDDALKDLVERLMALPPSTEIKGEEHAIMGKLTLHSVYERFRSDMFLSSLAESTIALPMGMSGDKAAPLLAPAIQDILGALDDADKLFWADLALTSQSGAVQHVREATVSLAMIRALQSSLGKVSTDAPLLAVGLLDASSAITLHREMLEAIRYKMGDVHVDDLQWPSMATDGSPLALARGDVRGQALDDDRQRAYWSALENKYSSLVLSPTALLERTPKLPRHWTVVHITLTPDKSSMFLSRLHMATSPQPVLFCVPLRGRRDGEEDEDEEPRLALEDALHELREIVRLSDEGARRAVHVRNDDVQARAGWWAERAALDKRMQTLLESIEFCWLGAFKTILSPPTTLTSGLIEDLRARLERVFKRSLGPQDKKRTPIKLGDELVACFSALSPTCRDEELEDVVCFVLDVCQFHGAPIAISEVDMDQVTVDLRGALEEHAGAKKRAGVEVIEDSHVFLVLDRSLQSIPWESLPVLRGQSVSRIPSMAFLMDRMDLAATTRGGEVDRVRVDVRKTYYVLNPSGDLKGTEGRFSAWLREMHEVGWEGIAGRAPSEQEMVNALSHKDLVIYFGHGGGEQYARSHKIRHLSRCAATMLWGCSSGALREMGEYDRVGTPHNYMIGGCPTLVANLWDVTDRDIDRLTRGVFDQLDVRGGRGRGRGRGGVSVVRAVAQARSTCKLAYLTGAAPVVYGLPFYL